MAARFWRSVLGGAVALAGLSGVFLALEFSLPPPIAVAIGIGVLAALLIAVVASSFVLAQSARNDLQARRKPRNALRALLGEIIEFPLAMLAMSFYIRPKMQAQAPAHGQAHAPLQAQAQAQLQARAPGAAEPALRPVLLLHGFLCNANIWRRLQMRLRTAGFGPIEALDVEPLLADIDFQAGRVAPSLLALQRRCHGERVVIVAHSMGGLIARALLRDLGAGAIRRIVTIASPHHGTALARGLPWPNTQQMSAVSPWLRALNLAQEGRFAVPIASIFSAEDNLVAPAASARLEAAELHELHGVGHLGILRSRQALDCVMTALTQADPR
ncbi:MAG TPA: alpha/beta fold hydrolase [Steroidobacteraceae bacterium]|nr:alpha/beta fold hydrolase [Steroidobacteraceae bacterium]